MSFTERPHEAARSGPAPPAIVDHWFLPPHGDQHFPRGKLKTECEMCWDLATVFQTAVHARVEQRWVEGSGIAWFGRTLCHGGPEDAFFVFGEVGVEKGKKKFVQRAPRTRLQRMMLFI